MNLELLQDWETRIYGLVREMELAGLPEHDALDQAMHVAWFVARAKVAAAKAIAPPVPSMTL